MAGPQTAKYCLGETYVKWKQLNSNRRCLRRRCCCFFFEIPIPMGLRIYTPVMHSEMRSHFKSRDKVSFIKNGTLVVGWENDESLENSFNMKCNVYVEKQQQSILSLFVFHGCPNWFCRFPVLYISRATPSLIRRLHRKRETGGGNLNALEGLFLFLVPSVNSEKSLVKLILFCLLQLWKKIWHRTKLGTTMTRPKGLEILLLCFLVSV